MKKPKTKIDGTVEGLDRLRYTDSTYWDYGDLSEDGSFSGGANSEYVAARQHKVGEQLRRLKLEIALSEPALYMCTHHPCDDRILIGIRDSGHIKYAVKVLSLLGWSYRRNKITNKDEFLCPNHRYLHRQLLVIPQ